MRGRSDGPSECGLIEGLLARPAPVVLDRGEAARQEDSSLVNTIMKDYSPIMTTIVDAIYENGKLVLQQPLPLPEHARVRVTVESDLERAAWLKLSEESLKHVWDNDADDIFNELLQK